MSETDRRVVYRIMLAATETAVDDDREACILGAIIRSLLSMGGPHRFDIPTVMHQTVELQKFGRYISADPDRFPVQPVDVFDIAPIQMRFRTCHKETR